MRIRSWSMLEETVPGGFMRLIVTGVLFFASLLLAQAPIGNISGIVKDPSGAVVAGAEVKITSASTAGTRATTTNSEGYFLVPGLQPGEYKLQISAAGFSESTIDRVVVEVGQTARVDVGLSLRAATTQIEVGTEAVKIETEQTSISGV